MIQMLLVGNVACAVVNVGELPCALMRLYTKY